MVKTTTPLLYTAIFAAISAADSQSDYYREFCYGYCGLLLSEYYNKVEALMANSTWLNFVIFSCLEGKPEHYIV